MECQELGSLIIPDRSLRYSAVVGTEFFECPFYAAPPRIMPAEKAATWAPVLDVTLNAFVFVITVNKHQISMSIKWNMSMIGRDGNHFTRNEIAQVFTERFVAVGRHRDLIAPVSQPHALPIVNS